MYKKFEPYLAMGIIALFCAGLFLPAHDLKDWDRRKKSLKLWLDSTKKKLRS